MNPRKDLETAALLDTSVGLAQSHGTYYAARALYLRGVSFEVVSRVLLHPNKRREYSATRPSKSAATPP